MSDAPSNPRISCLSLVLLFTVAAGVAAAFAFGYLGPRAASWTTVGAAALAAVAVFIIERRLKSFFWAVIATLLLAMHPQMRQPVQQDVELLAQASVLAALAAVAVGWHLAFHRKLAWRLWPLVAGALLAATGLTYAAEPPLGLAAAVLSGGTLLPAAVLARYRRLRLDAGVPARLNVLAALAVALLAPVGGLYLCRLLDLTSEPRFGESLAAAWQGYQEVPPTGLSLSGLNRWCWPTAWLVLPILAWSWWRSLRRGWRDWCAGALPMAWFVTFLTLLAASVLVPRPDGSLLVLVGLSVILGVFCLADMWKGIIEQLILLPPEEERDSQATWARNE